MALQKDNAYNAALNLVTEAVKSGVVKIRGVESTDYAAHHGEADAAYLIALIKGLQAGLPKD